MPEWNRLRGLRQHHPIHIFTVDRHAVQAVVEACGYLRTVSRPDLLLIAALLHDIGKGLVVGGSGDDHAALGAPIAAGIAERLGFDHADTQTIATLVRLHLLLPNIATRRDITDPVTVTGVADAVGDAATLDLLHALCLADATAAGPSATSSWKTRLIGELARHVKRRLADGTLPDEPYADGAVPDGSLPAVRITDDEVTVAAADRRGLLAAVSGALALHRLDVVGADTWTVDSRAFVRVAVAPRFGQAPDRTRLAVDLRQAATGELSADRLARVAASRPASRGTRRTTLTESVVSWHADATDATVLELRAPDASGLLRRVTRALERAGADVRSARVATLGGDVVDAFYLTGAWPDDKSRAQVAAAVLAAAG